MLTGTGWITSKAWIGNTQTPNDETPKEARISAECGILPEKRRSTGAVQDSTVGRVFFWLLAGLFFSNGALDSMNSYFNAADWWVIILYLGGIILLGVWFGKDQKNTRDYF